MLDSAVFNGVLVIDKYRIYPAMELYVFLRLETICT